MPSGTAQMYGPGLVNLLDGGVVWGSDDLYAALADSSYTPNIDTDEYWSSVVGDEVTGTGWSANGVQLAGETITLVTASDEVRLKANDISASTVTVSDGKHLVIYSRTPGSDATRELVGYVTFDDALEPQGGTLAIDFDDTNGIFVFPYA